MPVVSRHTPSYLEMLITNSPQEFCFRPTTLGAIKLNSFWREWLRDLLLTQRLPKHHRHSLQVTLGEAAVYVRPDHKINDDIVDFVFGAATHIGVMNEPITYRHGKTKSNYPAVMFEVNTGLSTAHVARIKEITIPGAVVTMSLFDDNKHRHGGTFLVRQRSAHGGVPIDELGRIFAYRVARITNQ